MRSHRLKLKAYAKINLYLRVLGLREDGYHEIETLFERVSLYDEIVLAPQDHGIALEVIGAELPARDENLAYRAAQFFKDHFGVKRGVRIQLSKNIPVAAGLGGGSSDAATVLLGLNQLWGLNATREDLMKVGGRLGADVPFFLLERRRALGKGRGDQVKEESISESDQYLLVTPPVSVLTRDVYKAWDELNALTPTPKDVKITDKFLTHWGNELEPIVISKCPVVKEVFSLLRQLDFSRVQLSGSGPTVFAETSDPKQARLGLTQVKSAHKDWRVEQVKGC